jgi:hypothetical protein
MTNGIFRVMLVAAAISIFAASMVLAADANAPAAPKPVPAPAPAPKPAPAPAPAPAPVPVAMKGTVSVTKDANDVVTAVKLTTENKVVHNVVLDKEGKELGKLAGKEVEAQVIKQGVNIKVVSFKPVEKAAEKPAEKPKM